jgi:hypothetical protein
MDLQQRLKLNNNPNAVIEDKNSNKQATEPEEKPKYSQPISVITAIPLILLLLIAGLEIYRMWTEITSSKH